LKIKKASTKGGKMVSIGGRIGEQTPGEHS
jgi:hypothetical protein